MKVGFYASQGHYVDHLDPIWRKMEPRPQFRVRSSFLEREGYITAPIWKRDEIDLVVVAGYPDLKQFSNIPAVLVNHGVGQTYGGDWRTDGDPHYSGGRNRQNVILYLCPGYRDVGTNLKAYPSARAEAVGCPKLDPWHKGERGKEKNKESPTVVVSFHWGPSLCPEMTSAYLHFEKTLPELAKSYSLVAHSHPRSSRRMANRYKRLGISFTKSFDEVLDNADLYITDNSSTLYEFASTDRPVVVLNSPEYRRDIEHGLRFWEMADVGVQVDDPVDLPGAVEEALRDPAPTRDRRREIINTVYSSHDGSASVRAAHAIMRLTGEG